MPTLSWRGKDAVLNHHLEVPYRLLKCEGALSAGTPGSGNLIVEGDNLQALKALLPYYKGQVKCIYIDPPYNTGNEGWIYNDRVNAPEIKAWLGEVVGKEAEDLNRHDKWLCMMWPRLKLLKEFLRPDGGIFVSIDDNETASLRLIMDEVFGHTAFRGNIVWQHSLQAKGYSGTLSIHHNHLVVYGMDEFLFGDLARTDDHNVNYSNPDNDPRGPWRASDVRNALVRKNLMYDIQTPSGKVIKHPPKGWRFSKETFEEELGAGKIVFSKDETRIIRKIYLADQTGRVPESIWHASEAGTTREATSEIDSIFDGKRVFETPKPVRLLQRVLEISTSPGDLILDSFAGSGTTAHAVMKLNAEDGGDRKFLLVEMEPKIARPVTAERVRRVAEGYTNAKGEAVAGLGGAFRYCTLSAPLFDGEGQLSGELSREALAHHLYFTESGEPLPHVVPGEGTLIGTFGDRALHLLFTPGQASLLDRAALRALPPFRGERVVFADGCSVPDGALAEAGVRFRQIPYDVRG